MNRELLAAGEALAALLEAENDALAQHDPDAVARSADAKSRALARFQAARTGATHAGLPHTELTDMLRRLDRAAAENRRLLERAILVQGRVLEIVSRAMPAPAAPYRRPGQGPGPRGAAPVVISARA